jgi:hypothetical protein
VFAMLFESMENSLTPWPPLGLFDKGIPLASVSFLLGTEGFSCLLRKREALGELYGIKNGRLSPHITLTICR